MNIVSVPKYIRKCEVEIRFRRTGAMGTELFYALKAVRLLMRPFRLLFSAKAVIPARTYQQPFERSPNTGMRGRIEKGVILPEALSTTVLPGKDILGIEIEDGPGENCHLT